MSEIVKSWLVDLYDSEIKNAKQSIANERIWLNGSDGDDDAVFSHSQNIENNEEYIECLESLIKQVEIES